MTQDLFLARPEDPFAYMQQRLEDWSSKGFRDTPKHDPLRSPDAVTPEAAKLGMEYLDKHNVRYLFVELGLRALRARPSDNPNGVKDYLGNLLVKEKVSILDSVDYMLDPGRCQIIMFNPVSLS